MRKIADKVAAWDVLILNAAHPLTPSTVLDAELNDWWTQYEVSVKSVIIAAQAFVPHAKPGAAIYGITSGALVLPPKFTPGLSAYLSAKTAQMNILGFLAYENPELFVVCVHPGIVEKTGVFISSGADAESLPIDKGGCTTKCRRSMLTQDFSRIACPLFGMAIAAKDEVFEQQDGVG